MDKDYWYHRAASSFYSALSNIHYELNTDNPSSVVLVAGDNWLKEEFNEELIHHIEVLLDKYELRKIPHTVKRYKQELHYWFFDKGEQ